ncbi:protein of unknown function [Micropruina glycogenica]|uniref:N-acetyltransferase domain-containing protein n=1 Tax=Micropruina glycogenica TaxID=75385 RepID=A0A2N9JJV1_9ACTN|nr:protein of unknown function [Micropruina glycogenica]
MGLRTEPATAGRFADVEAILAPKKAGAQGCWCLTYRLPLADNDALRQPHRAEELLRLCRRRSHVPGVLAYDGDEVVGWAAIAPRSELKGLAESHFCQRPGRSVGADLLSGAGGARTTGGGAGPAHRSGRVRRGPTRAGGGRLPGGRRRSAHRPHPGIGRPAVVVHRRRFSSGG